MRAVSALQQHHGSHPPGNVSEMGGKGKKAAKGAAKGAAASGATAEGTWACNCGGPRADSNYAYRNKCADCGKKRPSAPSQTAGAQPGRKAKAHPRQQPPPTPQPTAAPGWWWQQPPPQQAAPAFDLSQFSSRLIETVEKAMRKRAPGKSGKGKGGASAPAFGRGSRPPIAPTAATQPRGATPQPSTATPQPSASAPQPAASPAASRTLEEKLQDYRRNLAILMRSNFTKKYRAEQTSDLRSSTDDVQRQIEENQPDHVKLGKARKGREALLNEEESARKEKEAAWEREQKASEETRAAPGETSKAP